MSSPSWDLLLVGGGLANALIAWRLATRRTGLRWCLLEKSLDIGGTATPRTWSFHHSDFAPGAEWARALQNHTWGGYEVRFPDHARRLAGGYGSVRSDALHRAILERCGQHLRFGVDVADVKPTSIRLATGESLHAAMVVDGRGFGSRAAFPCGYQKFLGRDVRLAGPHGLTEPLLMDATVPQIDGYRFVYVLPLSADRLLLEDTYYSLSSELDDAVIDARLTTYAAGRGWRIVEEASPERGVLPIPLAARPDWALPTGVVASGVGAGRFHPTTGYSYAAAARLATELADESSFSPELADRINAASRAAWRDGAFFRKLNNMMFLAASPDRRWRIMSQFYRRDARLIQSFYRGDLSALDRLRVLSGRPPVPVGRALRAFLARPARPVQAFAAGEPT